jgi:hypothetical protein
MSDLNRVLLSSRHHLKEIPRRQAGVSIPIVSTSAIPRTGHQGARIVTNLSATGLGGNCNFLQLLYSQAAAANDCGTNVYALDQVRRKMFRAAVLGGGVTHTRIGVKLKLKSIQTERQSFANRLER